MNQVFFTSIILLITISNFLESIFTSPIYSSLSLIDKTDEKCLNNKETIPNLAIAIEYQLKSLSQEDNVKEKNFEEKFIRELLSFIKGYIQVYVDKKSKSKDGINSRTLTNIISDYDDLYAQIIKVPTDNKNSDALGEIETKAKLINKEYEQILDLLTKNINARKEKIDSLIEERNKKKIKETLLYTLNANDSIVSSLTYLENDLLASGNWNDEIMIWNVSTGKLIRTIKAHSGFINTLSYLENDLFASGDSLNNIKIWKISNGELIRTLNVNGPVDTIWALSYLGNDLLASGSSNNLIYIWNVLTGELVRTLSGHSDKVYCLSYLGNDLFASAGVDKSIKIWKASTGEMIRSINAHSDNIYTLSYLENDFLASGSWDNSIKIWIISTGELFRTINGHTGGVLTLIYLENNTFASGSNDNSIKIWNKLTGDLISTINGHTERVKCLSYLGNNKFASGSNDKSIKILSLEN